MLCSFKQSSSALIRVSRHTVIPGADGDILQMEIFLRNVNAFTKGNFYLIFRFSLMSAVSQN